MGLDSQFILEKFCFCLITHPPKKRTWLTFACLLAIVSVWSVFKPTGSLINPLATLGSETPTGRDQAVNSAVAQVPVSTPDGEIGKNDPAQHKTEAKRAPSAPAPARPTLPITAEFVTKLATGPGTVSFALPDGRTASGTILQRHLEKDGTPVGVTGRFTAPGKGSFYFRNQPQGSPAGPVAGMAAMDGENIAYRAVPGPNGTSILAMLPADQVACRNYIEPPAELLEPTEIPADHPTTIPIPAYQNGVIPLQSRPGAPGVIYLDFDGETGPHEGWGNFDAASPNVSNGIIRDVWVRVCEDYVPFNLNITTDLQVYLNADETSRQRCIITPTTTASPGYGGVAMIGSFNLAGDIPCWSFFSSGKNAAEIIAHEVGHTLSLYHDGRFFPSEDYYLGHGTDPVGWAPIMGAAYYKNLSQWSQGEYPSANQPQDDLAVIAANHNVGFRADAAGATHASAAVLEIFPSGVVRTQGAIETRSDVDAFRFTTTGGFVNLAVTTVTTGPNLDILASLYDDTGSLLLSDNPGSGLNATLAANLAPGEYSIRVDGTGRESPLVDGYSDFGSLGEYTISGTITGAVNPDRFTIAENSLPGTAVGTPTLRNDHAGAPLTYSITAGNNGSAFAIDPNTGAITVATPSALDYESLSTSWTEPPTLDLTVNVADSLNASLDESLRVVVAIENVNETPTISGPSEIIVISHTVTGTDLATVNASDTDPFDFAVYSIASGNAAGNFAISQSGVISSAGVIDSAVQSSYSLTVRATDQGSPTFSVDLPVTVTVIPAAATLSPGFVRHTIYEEIPGPAIGDLTGNAAFPASPTREIKLMDFTDTTQGDNYGSTVRAWLIAPHTGNYQFWIAGDDSADLNFDATANPAAATRICYVASPTGYQQWTLSGTQQSTAINLTAGQVCYIEAVHKEDYGNDHLSVAWQINDETNTTTIVPREVIPGRYLSPHLMNYAPRVSANTANLYQHSYQARSVSTPAVSDLNPGDSHIWSITSGNAAGIFSINPTTGQVSVANAAALAANTAPVIPLTLTATDNAMGPLSGTGNLQINLLAPAFVPTNGLIQEFWDNVVGTNLASLYALPRYPDRPDRLADLFIFDSGSGLADNYGARIRAYVIPQETGTYTFHIASDETSSLLLSTDSNPAHATEIASVASFTGYQMWSISPTQTSSPVMLTAGQRYFIEARVKEASGNDHLSVAWTGPTNPTITVIGEADTEPYDSNIAPAFESGSYSLTLPVDYDNGSVAGTVSASDSPFEEIRYAIVSGDPRGGFSIDPVTGAISVANTDNLSIGSISNLQIGAQDSGHGNHFPLRETLVPVTITVPGTNVPPVFSANPILLGSTAAEQPLSASIAGFVSDPRDVLSFAKVSGPTWLSVSTAGLLTGTPDSMQVGPYTIVVSADDGQGHVVLGNASLTVTPPPDVAGTTLTAAIAVPTLVTGTVLSGNPTNASTSDNTYLVLREISAGTSILEHRWSFSTPPDRIATLRVEAHHTTNNEGDDFQFSVSTDDGATFTNASLVTKTADDHAFQSFSFVTGAGNSTIIKVVDTNRTNGLNSLDRLIIDRLTLDIEGNSAPVVDASVFQVAHHAPIGVSIGAVSASDGNPGQTLTCSLPRGNEAGYFAMAPTGELFVAADIPEGAGPFSLIVVATDNGAPSRSNYATVTLEVVAPLPATIILSDLTASYDGNPHPVTATPDPGWLPLVVTYDGDPTPPIHPGIYQISARIISPIYAGTAVDTQTITKAAAQITLDNLNQTYDGTPRTVTFSTTPSNLPVEITYDGSTTAPTNGGTYVISATINHPDYAGSATANLDVGKAGATMQIGSLTQGYDGTQKSVSAITDPPGLDIEFTYDGSAVPPTDADTYAVVATIVSPNHSGGDTASFVITPAAVAINLTNLSQVYDGSPRTVTIDTTPPGVAIQVLYEGNSTPPFHAGSYNVAASATDSNFTGSATVSLEILKAQAAIELTGLSQAFDNTPKPVTATVMPSMLNLVVTYDASLDVPSAVGSYAVQVSVDDEDYFGSTSGTLSIRSNLVIATGETLNPPDTAPVYHSLLNDGTLVFGSGTLHIATDATNNGVLRLIGDAVLDISGSFINTGYIDIINWNGVLPPGLINTGTIIDRSAVRVLSTASNETNFTFTIPGFDGHVYQLQSTTSLDAPWLPLGVPLAGSGNLGAPPPLEFSPPIDGPAKLYRIEVTPAP